MLKLEPLLAKARAALIKADVPTPALDARLLMQHVLAFEHATMIATEHQLTDDQVAHFDIVLARRLAGEPVSRILGSREFYGRSFTTTSDVLDPRPDTETLVDACLAHLPPEQHQTILDLGTGSGILAITLAAERPHKRAVAADLSAQALAVANANAEMWNLSNRIAFIESNWFENVEGTFDLIVSNPPYIPAAVIQTLEIEVRSHDPHLALDGGIDGLDAYRAIASGARSHLDPSGIIAVEIGAGQEKHIVSIFAANDYYMESQHRDLSGHIRCLVFRAGPNRS